MNIDSCHGIDRQGVSSEIIIYDCINSHTNSLIIALYLYLDFSDKDTVVLLVII